jgi:hypothetical protein
MQAPKVPEIRDVKSSTRNAVIHEDDEDGEPEVTSRYRSVSESSTFSRNKTKKDLLWEHLVKLFCK